MRTFAIDFDGVMNTYTKWDGEDNLYEPRFGIKSFLEQVKQKGNYDKIVIYTTRKTLKVKDWLVQYDMYHLIDDVTNEKPFAICYLDDRGVYFPGYFTDSLIDKIANFKTHWELDIKGGN